MGRGGATLALKITGDASDGVRALDQTEKKSGLLGSGLSKLALGFGAVVGGAVALGKAAFDSASELEQQSGAIDAIFGKNAAKMHAYSVQAVDTVGLATSSYDRLASVLGAQLASAGFAGDALGGKVNNLIKLGADLSAQFGGSTSDAVEALSGVLKGETDPIERYGVSIKQSDINAVLLEKHQSKLTGTALKNATANAALGLVMKQTAAAHGQFAAQSGTAAEKAQHLSAWFENLKAKVGAGLLPVFTGAVSFFETKVAPTIEKLTSKTGSLGKIFDTVSNVTRSSIIPSIESLVKVYGEKAAPILATVGRIIQKDVMPAFRAVAKIVRDDVVPIVAKILGPALEGVSKLWGALEKALDRNRGKFEGILEKIKPLMTFLKNTVAPFIGGALKLGFEALSKVLGTVIDAIAYVLDKAADVGGAIGKIGNFLSNPFGAGGGGGGARGAGRVMGAARGAHASVFGASSGSLFGSGPAAAAAAGGRGGDVYITVQGALDPTAVAQQIAGLLDRRDRRVGLSVAVTAGGWS